MKDNPNVLNDILKCESGSVSFEQLHSLALYFPTLRVGVKMGVSPRFAVDADRVGMLVANRIATGDYVREMFIPADTYSTLRKALGIQKPLPAPLRMEKTIFDY